MTKSVQVLACFKNGFTCSSDEEILAGYHSVRDEIAVWIDEPFGGIKK